VASTLPQIRSHKPACAHTIPETENPALRDLLRSRFRFRTPPLLHYWHLVSLDAPTIAVVWSLAFAWTAHRHLPKWVLLLDALVVWAFYVGDRLFDAKRGLQHNGTGMLDRHWFHWRHRRLLAPLAIVALAGAACIAFKWMPNPLWKHDSLLGLASLAYFAGVHHGRFCKRVILKEMWVGVLFTFGCVLPALAWGNTLPTAFFAGLAWLNCAAIESWESSNQQFDVSKLAFVFALTGSTLAVFLVALQPRAALLLFCGAASAALLAALDRVRHHLTPLTLRTIADVVLLTPAIALVTMSFK
jgi:hypothetical protein